MSGAALNYRLEGDQEVLAALGEMRRRTYDMTELMVMIGEDIVAGVEEAFDAERSPEGQAWEKSHRAEREGGKTLQDKRRLSNSIHQVAGPASVAVGTNVIYGAGHQFGVDKGEFGEVLARVSAHTRSTRFGDVAVREHQRRTLVPWGDIPARPFLGISPATRAEIMESARLYLQGGDNG